MHLESCQVFLLDSVAGLYKLVIRLSVDRFSRFIQVSSCLVFLILYEFVAVDKLRNLF